MPTEIARARRRGAGAAEVPLWQQPIEARRVLQRGVQRPPPSLAEIRRREMEALQARGIRPGAVAARGITPEMLQPYGFGYPGGFLGGPVEPEEATTKFPHSLRAQYSQYRQRGRPGVQPYLMDELDWTIPGGGGYGGGGGYTYSPRYGGGGGGRTYYASPQRFAGPGLGRITARQLPRGRAQIMGRVTWRI